MNKGPTSIINKIVEGTRYVMVFAVLTIFLGSTVLLISGAFEMLRGIIEIFTHGIHGEELKIILIKSVDTILVSTVLYVIAIGLYQLFVNNSLKLPSWLKTESVSDLEHRLSGLIVTILGVFFLTEVYGGIHGLDLLWLGLAIGAVILAIGFFLRKDKN